MRIVSLLTAMVSVSFAYEVLDFDADTPDDAAQGDYIIIMMNDRSVKGDKLREVFTSAVEMLTLRDEGEKDEEREIHFIHWDTTIEQNKKHQVKFLGSDLHKRVSFPDILFMSEKNRFPMKF